MFFKESRQAVPFPPLSLLSLSFPLWSLRAWLLRLSLSTPLDSLSTPSFRSHRSAHSSRWLGPPRGLLESRPSGLNKRTGAEFH
jgi:hypothetical protein